MIVTLSAGLVGGANVGGPVGLPIVATITPGTDWIGCAIERTKLCLNRIG